MKGLLVGVLFAIQGVCISAHWNHYYSSSLPYSTICPLDLLSCSFVYLGFIILIGFILFAAKKYKYRERENITFCQRDVEEVYTHYLIQAPDTFDHSGENDINYMT